MYDACSDCVVVVVLGDLAAWRHFVRGLEGASQLFIIWPVNRVYYQVSSREIKGQAGE